MRLATLVTAVVLAISAPAAAQQTPNRGQPTTSAASELTVVATQPVVLFKTGRSDILRVMLRLSATEGDQIPYWIEKNGADHAVGWSTFTASAVTCELSSSGRIEGAPSGSRAAMVAADPLRWGVEGSRPAIVTVDFVCDGVVPRDEFLTLQTRFHVQVDGQWRQADYVFENIQVAARRPR